MAEPTTTTTYTQYNDSVISDIGTQLFVLEDAIMNYAFPVQAGGVFGGDTETYDAPETDLNYVPKISGRTSLDDVEYTINYSIDRYARVEKFTDSLDHYYAEIFKDGSGVVYKGTSGRATINNDNPKTITHKIAPSFMEWIKNVNDLGITLANKLKAENAALVDATGNKLNLNAASVPAARASYVVKPETTTPTPTED